MSSLPTPELPQYRITLFYGPEPLEEGPPRVSCVYNVKKRSWRGGVQVAVDVTDQQIARAREAVGFEPWLQKCLSSVPSEEQDAYTARAQDLFVQALCALKLDLAIDGGLSQENTSVPADRLVSELDQAVMTHADRCRSHILTELDLAV